MTITDSAPLGVCNTSGSDTEVAIGDALGRIPDRTYTAMVTTGSPRGPVTHPHAVT
jgi:hypothetical protein